MEELRGENNLALDIKNLFSSTHLEEKRSELPKQAISLLPLLFPKFVITTNFDETLEIVYKECHPLLHVIQPGHPELLKQFLRKSGSTGLFKLHGGVTGGFIEYSSIVFTEKQYDLHYAPNSPLTLDLKRCLKSKMMLFLGCSLGQDRTMDFLKSIIEPGEHHYTIINCKKAERDHKIKELSEKNIRAILYEEDRHEAVRVILEHLLEETNPEKYQENLKNKQMEQFGVKTEKCQKSDIKTAWKYFTQANQYYDSKKYDRAIDSLDKAIALQSDEPLFYNKRGLARYNLNQSDLAIDDYNKAIELDQYYAEPHCNRALIYADRGDSSAARSGFLVAIRLDPNCSEFYKQDGLFCLNSLGLYGQAIEDFNEAIKLKSDDESNYYNRGLAYYQLGQYSQAIEDFTNAIELNSYYQDAYYCRGQIYKELNKYNEAISDYSIIIKLNFKYKEAYLKRAEIYRLQGQIDKAIQDEEYAKKL